LTPVPQNVNHDSNGTAEAMRVLIVRVGAMGDVLHALPAVAALRQALPACFIGWAIEPRWAPLLATDTATERTAGPPPPCAMPIVDHVHPVPSQDWKRRPFRLQTVREIAALRREILAQHYDVVVDLQGSIRSAVIGCMAGRSRLTGPDEPREGAARWLYGHRVHTSSTHVIDQAAELLSQATGMTLAPVAPMLPDDAHAAGWAAGLLARIDVAPGGRFVLLSPAAGWGGKQWGLERYKALAQALTRAGLPVLINAAPQDAALLATAFARLDKIHVVPSSLPQLIALTRCAALVIGGDSGPIHLAAALGRTVLTLFGPTDPARTSPSFPGAQVHILRHETSRTDHRRHAATEAGLSSIPVEQVTEAALRLLGMPPGEESSFA
jgi:heptosyltransferase-1